MILLLSILINVVSAQNMLSPYACNPIMTDTEVAYSPKVKEHYESLKESDKHYCGHFQLTSCIDFIKSKRLTYTMECYDDTHQNILIKLKVITIQKRGLQTIKKIKISERSLD